MPKNVTNLRPGLFFWGFQPYKSLCGDDDGGGDGGYHIHQSVSAVHSAGEALSSLSGHNVDKLKQ